ncbi:MAG: hypothetical protein DRG25_06845 [Deltaproteobacteria bacterium]|nr:MAG: hypothetical protein DRG25_06845 [Deltaproteobacteria bacterium]
MQDNEELKRSKKPLITLLHSLPGMVFKCRNDRDRTMEFVSNGCYELTGYRASELIHNRKVTYGELIHPDDRSLVWDEVEKALEENRLLRLHYRIITASGEEKWVLEHSYGVASTEETIKRMLGFVIDFTEYRQTEEELTRTKEKLDKINTILISQSKELKRSLKELSVLFEASKKVSSSLSLPEILNSILDFFMEEFRIDGGSILLIDEDGYLRVRTHRGLSPDFVKSAEQKPTEDTCSGECFLKNKIIIIKDAEQVSKPIFNNLEVEEGIKSFSLIPIGIEDEVIGILYCVSKTKKGYFSEEYIEFIKAFVQQLALAIRNARLYERVKNFSKELEKEVEKRTEELKEKSKLLAQSEKLAALGEMADRVAHETRNPIVTIGGFARRIQRKLSPDDPLRKDIGIVIKEVERLEKMVYWITEYKKYISVDFEATNINLIIERALAGVKDKIKKRNVTIQKDLLPNPPLVRVDRKNMEFALFNLFENGIEAIENHGVLRIATRVEREDCLEVIVSDTGKGIAEKDLKSIYDPFFTSKMSGAGMGLTIAHKIVKDHNGLIKVKSKKGEGTTFTIELPLASTIN